MAVKPLFIPLKAEFFWAFVDGSKKIEYRKYGPRWNEKTLKAGRPVVLSLGYGKKHRVNGVIVTWWKENMSSDAWMKCYKEPDLAAAIEIKVYRNFSF